MKLSLLLSVVFFGQTVLAAPPPFDGESAYKFLAQLTQIGPRPSGSTGMAAQQKLLVELFEKQGAQVEWQRFTAKDPRDGSDLPMANLIVHWHPTLPDRVVLAAHYDTLPLPLMDAANPNGVFVGANDNGSGLAILMELGRTMKERPVRYGVDFVLFDGEEFVFQKEGQPMFLGALEFANQYAAHPPSYKYHWGILLDMVGKKDVRIRQEVYGLSWEDTRPLVQAVWSLAAGLRVDAFESAVGFQVQDDHVPMHDLAKIPTIDLIDMDYPAWHTTADTLDQCSAESLGKVGQVLAAWLSYPELPTH